MTAKTDRAALAALMIGAVAIGFAPIFVRLSDAGAAATGFWRLLLPIPVLVLLLARQAGGIEPARRQADGWPWRTGLLAGLLFAGDMAFWNYGVRLTSVTNSTVLTNLTPVIVTAGAWFLFRERPRASFLAALALALSGAFVMATAKGSGGTGSNPPLGDLLSLITAFWYGAYFLAVRQARSSVGTYGLMLMSSLSGSVAMLAAAAALGEPLVPATGVGWAACFGLATAHLVGQGAIAWALGRLPAAIASVVVVLQPVTAALLAWAIFSEAIGPVQAAGAAIALAGVVLAQRSGMKKGAPA